MTKFGLLIFGIALLSILLSCSKELPRNQIEIEFEQSAYFIAKSCEQPLVGRLRVVIPNPTDSLQLAIRIEENTIVEYTLPLRALIIRWPYIKVLEFNLPHYSEINKDSIRCIAEIINGKDDEKVTQLSTIHFVDSGDEISYEVRKWGGEALSVSHAPWINYEGRAIPANSKYEVLKNMNIQDDKIADFWQRRIYFEITLKDEISGERFEMNPHLDLVFKLDPRINLYENGQLIFEEAGFPGAIIEYSYTTKDESPYYLPRFVLYEHVIKEIVQGTMVSCDSIKESQRTELKFPYKLGFRLDPES